MGGRVYWDFISCLKSRTHTRAHTPLRVWMAWWRSSAHAADAIAFLLALSLAAPSPLLFLRLQPDDVRGTLDADALSAEAFVRGVRCKCARRRVGETNEYACAPTCAHTKQDPQYAKSASACQKSGRIRLP